MTRLYHGDCLQVLKKFHTNSIDSIVCDPPYGIGILNKKWDQNLVKIEVWKECHRVLKPGGHILAFSSPRLYHRQAVRMEEAGFDTFSMLAWIYGSGFPKGKNLAREFDRKVDVPKPDDKFREYLRAAIKNSSYKIVELEKICGTRGIFCHYLGKSQPIYPSLKVWKILKSTLNLDSSYDSFFTDLEKKRQAYKKEKSDVSKRFLSNMDKNSDGYQAQSDLAKKWQGFYYGKQTLRPSMESIYFGQKSCLRSVPENVKNWDVGALDLHQTKVKGSDKKKRILSSVLVQKELKISNSTGIENTLSRFQTDPFFCLPKPSKKERTENPHPTVKPIDLMRTLVRLVTPQGGLCLDPFMGSGTTGVACLLESREFIGIEKEKEYFDFASRRVEGMQRDDNEIQKTA